MTSTQLHQRYAVHELLIPGDAFTSCNEEEMHSAEEVGMDIFCENVVDGSGEEGRGVWKCFLNAEEIKGGRGREEKERIEVDAGCINHRVRCLGYIFRSVPQPSAFSPELNTGRKIAVLGDTSDASNIIPLAMDATLLVHEATDTFVPNDLGAGAYFGQQVPQGQSQMRAHSPIQQVESSSQQPQHARSYSYPQNVSPNASTAKQKTALDTENKMIAKGHSTAIMGGAFAKKIRARMFYMNHISAK